MREGNPILISIVAGNTRGLNDPIKTYEVNKFRLDSNLIILGLLETKVREGRFEEISRIYWPNWCVISNYASDNYGRVGLC